MNTEAAEHHTVEAKRLIIAGLLSPDDPRTLITYEDHGLVSQAFASRSLHQTQANLPAS